MDRDNCHLRFEDEGVLLLLPEKLVRSDIIYGNNTNGMTSDWISSYRQMANKLYKKYMGRFFFWS